MRHTTLHAAALLLLVPSALRAQAASDPRVDRIFAAYDRADSPGCAVGVVRDGRFVLQRGYGAADLDHAIPNGPAMVYYVGSVSKQFTAAAIGLLALDGRLSLDDPVRKWVPELPDYGTPLTVRHLVHHTSGVRDIYNLMGLRGDRLEDVFPDSQALALIARQKGTAFTPGTRYSYSNSGYFLLGVIVQRASGQSLREFTDARLFKPLGMTRTHFHDDGQHVLAGRAFAYERSDSGTYRLSWLQNFDKVGAGGLWTTLDDLRKWDENYYTPKVGGAALQAMIHTRGVLANGDTLPYAFGNTVSRHRGLRLTEHGGSLMGYKAYIGRWPDERLTVLLQCNLGAIDPERLGRAVAEVYLGDRMAKAAPPAAATGTATPPAATASRAPAAPPSATEEAT
jgi:CubicO group peptidase (beta-lactamase class C family)